MHALAPICPNLQLGGSNLTAPRLSGFAEGLARQAPEELTLPDRVGETRECTAICK